MDLEYMLKTSYIFNVAPFHSLRFSFVKAPLLNCSTLIEDAGKGENNCILRSHSVLDGSHLVTDHFSLSRKLS
jgi:hypothetical protein